VGTYEEKYVNTRFDNSNIAHRQLLDMNRDLVVDLWKFYEKKQSSDEEQGELVLIRKEVDGNFDGRIDSILYYNEHEALIREELDTNFDGEVDVVRYYSNSQLAKVENYSASQANYKIDEAGDVTAVPSSTRFYRKGVLTREEVDDDLDGKLNVVIVFDANGKIVQKGFDHNGDGQINAWERY
jgi:antitoxin component YwqK of YwqJK toxin-antitoxin module